MPKLVRAKLIRRDALDGTPFVKDAVPLGKNYWIDVWSIRRGRWARSDRPGLIARENVAVWDEPGGEFTGWLPTELLDWEGKSEIQAREQNV